MDIVRKYEVGDIVRIKDLKTLKEELGDPIMAQCGWSLDMNEFAGLECEVLEYDYFTGRGPHFSYRLDGAGRFYYSEDVLEPAIDHDSGETTTECALSYDQCMRFDIS